MSKLSFCRVSGMALAALLSACTTTPADQNIAMTTPEVSPDNAPLRVTANPLSPASAPRAGVELKEVPKANNTLLSGTGEFIDLKAAAVKSSPARTQSAPGEVSLNFEGADIRDVAKVVFETLKENYMVDPQVQGEVTVQTSQPLAPNQLLPTLETLLRMNNAVLVREGGLYRILPAAGAVKQGNLTPRPGGSGGGYSVRIVPLRYISATEMQTIIAPLLPDGAVLRADVARNLLVLAGTPQELASIQTTIDTFDVNWLKGMSVGIFRLRNVDSQAMAANLNQVLGEGSGTPIAGLLRFVPLSKLNAMLVITPQKEYLREVAAWIERLDGFGGERLYVYHVQNSRAEYLADMLNGLFNLGGGGGGGSGGAVAPGLKPAQASSGLSTGGGLAGGGGLSTGGGGASTGGALPPAGSAPASGGRPGSSASSSMGSGGPSAGMEEVRIVADIENNSLLIWATNQNHERIVNTLGRMDVPPRQVLIEATIAEVTLTGKLSYGVQWYFNNDLGDYTGHGFLGLTDRNIPLDPTTVTDGTTTTVAKGLAIAADKFTYVITGGNRVKALITALANDGKVRVLSAPHVMALDSQQAQIRVGTQQPIPAGTTTTNTVTVSGGVTYKDTGVFLKVLPRINSGGMVNMDILQEVIDVGPLVDVTSAGDTGSAVAVKQRAYLQRSVSSKVAVKSGQTVVLGGLIRDNRSEGQSGIPVLYKIPVLGALFGNTEEVIDRTELIVLITPRVVESSQEAEQVTDEIKRKMQSITPMLPPPAG